MRKKYLVEAILCSLLGTNAVLAQDSAPAPAAPAAPQDAAGLNDELRTMSPEQRRVYLIEQRAKMREQAEASMPAPPGSDELKERHEKLKEMTPEERRGYLQEDSDKRRAEAEAAMPMAPVPPPPLQGGMGQAALPSAEQARQRHDTLKAMTPEARRDYLRAESEQRRQEAEAAMPSPPAPPLPPFGGAPDPAGSPAEEAKARHEQLRGMTPEARRAQLQQESEQRRAEAEATMPAPPMPPGPLFGGEGQAPSAAAAYEKMRNMTPEQRRAYRNQRYQELRRQAAAEGLDLPQMPPWAEQPSTGVRYMTDEERTAHWETMRGLSPDERAVYRAEHHQRMMERAQAAAEGAPEIPEWVKQQQEQAEALQRKIEAMSADDREACFAMHRMMQQRGRGMGYGQRGPVGPGVGQAFAPAVTPEPPPAGGVFDYPSEPYGPGFGYGPGYGGARGYGPGPGYGQDYPPAPNYGYGAQSRPGYAY